MKPAANINSSIIGNAFLSENGVLTLFTIGDDPLFS